MTLSLDFLISSVAITAGRLAGPPLKKQLAACLNPFAGNHFGVSRRHMVLMDPVIGVVRA
jgi:hypothetical protein